MKKLILSATFALACFTAQAQTTTTPEIPKTPTTEPQSETFLLTPGKCCRGYSMGSTCDDGVVYGGYACAWTCAAALAAAVGQAVNGAMGCN